MRRSGTISPVPRASAKRCSKRWRAEDGRAHIKLPDVGEGVAEAELVEWHVKVGDLVREDAMLAAVMTDKATVEIPSPVEGKVAWLGAEIGDTVAGRLADRAAGSGGRCEGRPAAPGEAAKPPEACASADKPEPEKPASTRPVTAKAAYCG
jgi:2-oxoisovalerate dehydrogenase E2 component (dihydrolipoyl transacylase)